MAGAAKNVKKIKDPCQITRLKRCRNLAMLMAVTRGSPG
jgi:hypothetical protein